MRVIVLQENIARAAQDALRFISNKPQLQVLSGIRLEARGGELLLSATDLTMGIQLRIGGKVEEVGACVVPGKTLVELLASLVPGNVELWVEGEVLTVVSGGLRADLQCLPVAEYPDFPAAGSSGFSVSSEEFFRAVSLATIAAGIDETRPLFTALLWELSESPAYVCTDGYRLARFVSREEKKKKNDEDKRLLVPTRTVVELQRVFERGVGGELKISLSEGDRQLMFAFDKTNVFARLIEGEFPDYKRILPEEFSFSCEIEKEELERTIKRAMIFARDSSGMVKFAFTKESATISSSSASAGKHETAVSIDGARGGGGVIAFNGKYILDFLGRVKEPRVWFGMNDATHPGEFRIVGMERFRYIVMPFRIQE